MPSDKDIIIPKDCNNHLLEIFGEQYQYARDIIIYGETTTLELQWEGMANMRDAFDHLRNFVFYVQNNNENAKQELIEIDSHIRRAIVETSQNICEHYLDNIIKKINTPRMIYKITFVDIPEKNKVDKMLKLAKNKIRKGRELKPNQWKEAVKNFKEAEELLKSLNDKYPKPNEAKFKLMMIGLTVLGIIIGYIGAKTI